MPPTIATSLKLPAELKAAIDEDAKKLGMSSHAYMVKTLAESAERSRLRDRFHQDSLDALREMNETGLGHSWDEVKAYFRQMAEFRAGCGERPAPLVPKKMA
jgi:predicted transcriptional regulator